MSGVFKAIGKVFKKVVKVVKKVAIPALMIGAIVLTGGAALGVLPAMGTMLGGIGISGTLASVLGGAISMGAVGAVTGGLGAAASGKSIWKGAQTGFLVGAATGGVMGGLGAVSANGVLADIGIGAGSKAAIQTAATATSAAPASTGLLAQGGAVAPAAVAPGATAPLVAAKAGGGLLSSASAPMLIQAAGQVISGFAKGAGSGDDIRERAMYDAEAERLEYDRTAYNYGYRNLYNRDAKGRVIDGVPTSQEAFYQYGPQTLQSPNAGLLGGMTVPSAAARAPMFQIVNGQVVRV